MFNSAAFNTRQYNQINLGLYVVINSLPGLAQSITSSEATVALTNSKRSQQPTAIKDNSLALSSSNEQPLALSASGNTVIL